MGKVRIFRAKPATKQVGHGQLAGGKAKEQLRKDVVEEGRLDDLSATPWVHLALHQPLGGREVGGTPLARGGAVLWPGLWALLLFSCFYGDLVGVARGGFPGVPSAGAGPHLPGLISACPSSAGVLRAVGLCGVAAPGAASLGGLGWTGSPASSAA